MYEGDGQLWLVNGELTNVRPPWNNLKLPSIGRSLRDPPIDASLKGSGVLDRGNLERGIKSRVFNFGVRLGWDWFKIEGRSLEIRVEEMKRRRLVIVWGYFSITDRQRQFSAGGEVAIVAEERQWVAYGFQRLDF